MFAYNAPFSDQLRNNEKVPLMGSIAWKRECREDNEESTMTKASRTENRLTRLGTCVVEDSRLKPETRLSQIDFRIRQSARMPSSVVTDEGFSQISFSHFPLFPSFWESAQCSATCTAQSPAERSMKCGADGCVRTFHSGRSDYFHYSPLLVPPTPRVYILFTIIIFIKAYETTKIKSPMVVLPRPARSPR